MTDNHLFTLPPRLTDRQRTVYQLAQAGPVTATAAGIHLHLTFPSKNVAGWVCGCTPGQPCQWATPAGRSVLESLKKKGLLRRDRHHLYRPTTETSGAQTDDIPY